MDPITLAMLGTTGISSIMGGIEANRNAQTNADISLMNYYQQEAANQRGRQEAGRQQREAKLGTTDAAGNRTYFMPGVGWVTDLSDDQQAIQSASEDEQLRQLRQGERDEVVQERAAGRRGREDISADEAERQYRQARRPDEGALRQLLLARGGEARNQSADRAGEMAARAATRRGGTNAAMLTQGARAASDATSARQAGIDAQLMAGQEADRQFAQDRDSANSLYDYFRKMSTSGTGSAPVFQPQGPQRTSTAMADQLAGNAAGRTAAMDYQSPNYATASTIGDISSAFQAARSSAQNNELLDMLRNRQGRNVGNL